MAVMTLKQQRFADEYIHQRECDIDSNNGWVQSEICKYKRK